MQQMNTSEAQFLNKLLTDRNLKSFFDSQVTGINEDCFTEDITKGVWNFVKTHVEQYRNLPDLRTVKEQIPQFEPGDSPERIEYYQSKVINQKQKIIIAGFARTIAELVTTDETVKAIETIRNTYEILVKNTQISEFGKFRDMLDRIESYQGRIGSGESPMGVPTGITPLDQHFLGFRPGDYGVLSGRPGEGKTTLALFMAFSAFMAGYKVSYITLEMPREQLFEKLDALATGISINKIKKLALTPAEVQHYKEKAEEIHSHTSDILVHDRTGSCTIVTIEAIINQDEPDIIFIDPLYLMQKPKGMKDWEGIKQNSNDLKQLAMRYKKPIIITSQINREGKGALNMGDAPSIENLSYSDAIGQDADHAFVLTGNERTRHFQAKRLTSIKLRGAEPKDIVIKWDPKTNFVEFMYDYARMPNIDTRTADILSMQEANRASGPLDA